MSLTSWRSRTELYIARCSKIAPSPPTILSGNPSLIASSIRLARADQELIQTQRYSNTFLREMLRAIDQGYDYVLIDCQPNLGILTSSALVAADLAHIRLLQNTTLEYNQ